MKPLLIVVSGCPGSGKTTLARLISNRVCCPLVSRDEIKEGYCITSGADHVGLPADTNKNLYNDYFDILSLYISKGISVVTEAAFQHKLWAPKLQAARAVADIRLIRCTIDPVIARDRVITRGRENPRRERLHRNISPQIADSELEDLITDHTPPTIDCPTLDVNTDRGYTPSLDEIILFVAN